MTNVSSVIVLLLFIHLSNLSAQQNFCGTPVPNSPIFVDVGALQRGENRSSDVPEVVEVFVHFIYDDFGGYPEINMDTFLARFENMTDLFSIHNICFLLVGSQLILDSDLNIHKIFGEGPENNEQSEVIPYLKPGVLNVFVHHILIHGDVTGGGNAYAIPNTYLSIDDDALFADCCTGTLAHEVGHCLGLYHTFQWNWGGSGQIRENVARTGSCANCTTKGDLLCDTPADPHELASISMDTTYLKVWDHVTDCVFDTSILDGCGDLYNPDETNIMSYFADSCHTNFTPGQGVRALSFLNGSVQVLKAPENLNLNSNATNSSGEFIHTAKQLVTYSAANLTYSNSAIVWAAAGDAILVQPGTTFSPSSGFALLSAQSTCQ